MKELKEIIGNNISLLRKQNDMTQQELADELAYSDKSVSKWERGEASPDVEVLVKLSKLFQISVDSLLSENVIDNQGKDNIKRQGQIKANKIIITCLSISAIWLIATVLFITGKFLDNKLNWPIFIWAIPLSCVLLLIFNCIWGKKTWICFLVSLIVWSLIACFNLQFLLNTGYNIWYIYFLGIPLQVAAILWHILIKTSKKNK